MDAQNSTLPTGGCHLVAMPYPGRGHINPMLNLCASLLSSLHRRSRPAHSLIITVVVTEEWLGLLASSHRELSHSHPDMRFRSIPNVVPSELVRAADMVAFLEAVSNDMEAPLERLLDCLDPPPTAIVADAFLPWAVDVGKRREITVASLWTMAAATFDGIHRYRLAHRGDDSVDLSGKNLARGVSPTQPTDIQASSKYILNRGVTATCKACRADYRLFGCVYELEAPVIEALKSTLQLPIYTIGPLIPYPKLKELTTTTSNEGDDDLNCNIMKWLDSQPPSSVLYMSFGSFISVSAAQLDEIIAGISATGIRYLWVAREKTDSLRERCGRDGSGLVVPWCDQLRVLSHFSTGGFWTHCGWNSLMEAIFSGVPMLAFPLAADQTRNAKLVVEDWKIGVRMRKEGSAPEDLEKREEIKETVQRFMDTGSHERKEMWRRVKELQDHCHGAVSEGGSSEWGINAFLADILHCVRGVPMKSE